MRSAATDRVLPTIFSVFLGLMVTAFVGVGVNTFHPPPGEFDARREAVERRADSIQAGRRVDSLAPFERRAVDSLRSARYEVVAAEAEARADWQRSTSIILIVLATVCMALALVRTAELPVLSNGLLLGGIFTMLYGVGWIIGAEVSTTRFVVVTVALAITIGLGYVRFARGRAARAAAADAGDATDTGALERRVTVLERRISAAAALLVSDDERGED